MKFDYCLGNPPYQSDTFKDNVPIWPKFITSKLGLKKVFIHPGRWINGSSSYIKIYEDMKKCGLKQFSYWPQSTDVFPSISLDGGVSITYLEDGYNSSIDYFVNNKYKGIFEENSTFFRDDFLQEAYTKIFNKLTISTTIQQRIRTDINTDGIHCYSYIKDKNLDLLQETSKDMFEPVKIWISKTQGRGESKFMWYYIEKSNLNNIDNYLYSSKKVMIDGRGHSLVHGKGNGFNNLPQICDRNQIAFGNILIFPAQEKERDLLLIKSLFLTKTARYLMSISQIGLKVMGFENIPDYLELAKLLPENELFTDEWFYKTFNFSAELINEIETRVSPKVDKQK